MATSMGWRDVGQVDWHCARQHAALAALAALAVCAPLVRPAAPGAAFQTFRASRFPGYREKKAEAHSHGYEGLRSTMTRSTHFRAAVWRLVRLTFPHVSVVLAERGAPYDMLLGADSANVILRSMNWHGRRFTVAVGDGLQGRRGRLDSQRWILAVVTPGYDVHLYDYPSRVGKRFSAPNSVEDPKLAMKFIDQELLAHPRVFKIADGSLTELLGYPPTEARPGDLAADGFRGTPFGSSNPLFCCDLFSKMVCEFMSQLRDVTRRSRSGVDSIRNGFVSKGCMVAVRMSRLGYSVANDRWALYLFPMRRELFDEVILACWVPGQLHIVSIPENYRFHICKGWFDEDDGHGIRMLLLQGIKTHAQAWDYCVKKLVFDGCQHLATVILD